MGCCCVARIRAEWGLAPDRLGIMGFSAGGHLAAATATQFSKRGYQAVDGADKLSCRPDFAILVYPVISLPADCTHQGSKRNLLGPNPDPKLGESLSNEKQVTPQTPPCFLVHTWEDKGVPAENSICFYLALRKANVPAEMHIYERGPHGVGLAQTDEALSSWPARLAAWLRVPPPSNASK